MPRKTGSRALPPPASAVGPDEAPVSSTTSLSSRINRTFPVDSPLLSEARAAG